MHPKSRLVLAAGVALALGTGTLARRVAGGPKFPAAGLLAALVAAWPTRAATTAEIATLVERRGCTTCHAARPSRAAPDAPIAPSWEEIAVRYRNLPGAPEKLTAVVVGGTNGRHWPETAFKGMLPREGALRPDQAREVVRWILDR